MDCREWCSAEKKTSSSASSDTNSLTSNATRVFMLRRGPSSKGQSVLCVGNVRRLSGKPNQ